MWFFDVMDQHFSSVDRMHCLATRQPHISHPPDCSRAWMKAKWIDV